MLQHTSGVRGHAPYEAIELNSLALQRASAHPHARPIASGKHCIANSRQWHAGDAQCQVHADFSLLI